MYVDGLNCSRLTREHLLVLRDAGIGVITNTTGFWEDATESMDELVRWRQLVRSNADLVAIARTYEEIIRIGSSDRIAMLIGFQNSSLLQGRLGFVGLFAEMGLSVMQLTYNIQNDVGGSCYDPTDSGLTRFGEEVVEQMNEHGIVIDLSHVGNRTSMEVIDASADPVAFTHANCADLAPHPRNKPSAVLKRLAERGGVIGVTPYWNLARGFSESSAGWAELVARTVDIVGIDHVAIGTDANMGPSDEFRAWMRNGRWSWREQAGASIGGVDGTRATWFAGPHQFDLLESSLVDHGFSESEADKVVRDNWLTFYKEVLR